MNLLYSTNIYKINYDLSKVRNLIPSVQFLVGIRNITKIKAYIGGLSKSQTRSYRNTRKNAKRIMWDDYIFDLSQSTILKDSLIIDAINSFWAKNVCHLKDEHLIVLFRIKTNNGIIYTIGKLISLSACSEDKKYFFEYIINNLYIKSDEYRQVKLSSIIISFGIRKGNIEKKTLFASLEHIEKDLDVVHQIYRKYKLPVTMDPLKYGKLISIEKSDTSNFYYVQITPLTNAKIIQENNLTNEVTIFKNGEAILEYRDNIINDGQTILRMIGDNKFYYNLEGKLEIVNSKKLTKYIKPLKISCSGTPTFNNKFITLDIETRLINGKHVPFLISWFKDQEKNKNSFYLTNYNNPDAMIKECILSLCKGKFNYHKIYIHNFANFDGIFLLKNLTDLAKKVDVIINEGKLISVDFYYQKENWKVPMVLSFRDSFQILPASLKKLAKAFEVTTQKSIFPYNFVNLPNINLLYSGKVPAFKYFYEITYDEYVQYCSNFKDKNWSLHLEASKYCLQDCKALHEVISKFNELYFSEFKLNINDAPTISSHAFKLFRSKFMQLNTIPMVYGEESNFIRSSYTGGATDMYIPTNNNTSNTTNSDLSYAYDINSVYPYIMKNYPMPVGESFYFEGDIRKINPEAFGFFFCEVETPSNLIHPIIQLHVKTKSGIRTIAPLGTFKTVIFSPEMDNAINLGYKFKIIKGYTYDRKIIFDQYVDKLYKLRLLYNKSHPMNYIAKLLLNSLYGRFGMKDIFDTILLLSGEKYEKYTDKLDSENFYITETIKLNDNYLVKFEDKVKNYNRESEYNVNVAIAAAITGYARIYMSQFKNNPKIKLFYTDTDSIYTNLKPEEMNNLIPGIVNNTKLGKLKLESISKRAIFLAPKCYALESIEGNLTYKVKGLINKSQITFNDFESLLSKNSEVKFYQTKWHKSLSEGTISILEQSYTLQQTDNKRELVYDSNNNLIGTKPYSLINSELIVAKSN